jgi:lysophospholipase L1-like esterase
MGDEKPLSAPRPIITIACVGDSLTDAHSGRCELGAQQMWPALLQEELGSLFVVRNFGASGVPVQRFHEWGPMGHLNEVLELKPEVIVVMLGTNDAWM